MSSKDGKSRSLTQQLDSINRQKRKIAANSQHYERIHKLTKNLSELQDMEKRVMDCRQKFLNYGLKNF
ncbi:hypothetical protein [Epiphyas postvittana nucleopolyhedrovirus]|uniref:Uncharacterized protein n=1 Tax=Epiphyas postvittana nucleopolyhedrovirus TaxID=70600 RepID=Q91GL9_NPVEP|nr:hypothetical protein [Epiphyas postvittana nucleopolyhedrovirus]AAK85595.1 unknown [Epiphyas postvittana nucleopolyhedrovirus]